MTVAGDRLVVAPTRYSRDRDVTLRVAFAPSSDGWCVLAVERAPDQ